MSELIKKLKAEGQKHIGTDLGKLLQWAALHIADQDAALVEVREEFEAEENERIKMERAIFEARQKLFDISSALDFSRPVNIQLAKDHAPHINIMAQHGVAPYAKKTRKSAI